MLNEDLRFESLVIFRETKANSSCYTLTGTDFRCFDSVEISSLEGTCSWDGSSRGSSYNLQFTLKTSAGELSINRQCSDSPHIAPFSCDFMGERMAYRVSLKNMDSQLLDGTGYFGEPSVYQANMMFEIRFFSAEDDN